MFFRRIQKKDMKDHCLYILFLVAVLSFAACKKTEIKEPEYGPDSIQAFLPETKTSFSDEGTFSWEAGDALSVADGSGTFSTFTLSQGAGTSKARFSGTYTDGTPGEIAFSPAGSHSLTQFVLPSSYTWQEGCSNAPMLGRRGSAGYTFRHLGGVMRFTFTNIPADARRFIFSVPKRVCGSFPIDFAQDDATISASDGTSTVTFTFDKPASPMVFNVPLPTGVYDDFSVWFANASGQEISGTRIAAHQAANRIDRGTLRLMSERNLDTSPCRGELKRATSSTLSFRFTATGFSNIATDITHAYTVSLYKDAACSNLLVSWDLAADFFNATEYLPAFLFSGLSADTDYWFRVKDKTASAESLPVHGRTRTFTPVVPGSGTASVGDILLAEDFSEFIWGGSFVNGENAAGYSANNRTKATSLKPATGVNPVGDATYNQYLVPCSTEMGLFNTLGKAVPSTRLKTWAQISEEGTNRDAAVCIRPGYLKIGANSLCGVVATPPLNQLPDGYNTVRVTFDAQSYFNNGMDAKGNDPRHIKIEVVTGGTVGSNSHLAGCTRIPAIAFELHPENRLKAYTFDIPNVRTGDRIAIGGDPAYRTGQERFYLDNLVLTLKANEPAARPATIAGTPILSTSNAAGQITDATTGKGIPGVPVTDGYQYVVTDANGVYQMAANSKCRYVYLSLPAAYKIPMKGSAPSIPQLNAPRRFRNGDFNRNDFKLEPLDAPEESFSVIMIGDPQCKTAANVSRWQKESIPSIVSVAKETDPSHPMLFAMTLGDITHDNTVQWDPMYASMSSVSLGDGRYLPFFQTIGNHDHDAAQSDFYDAQENFATRFGPLDYSFNRGKVHIVSMDNVVGYHSTGSTWQYYAGYSDEQLEWLKQDLALVPDKASKMVLLCGHIPFRAGGGSTTGSNVNKSRHYADVLNLLKQFKEAHLMIGHTHYNQNYIHTNYVAAGGQPIYEHIHGAACGSWWTCHSNVTGGPNGYTIYTVDGASITDWVMKGTRNDYDYQLRVYDGNQTYSGTKGHTYTWYNGGTGGSAGIKATGYYTLKGCFIAEVFDDESLFGGTSNWTVEFWQNGKKAGNFVRVPDGSCGQIAITAYYFNEKAKNTDTWVNKTASHYWYYRPASQIPASETNWEVRAIQTIPTSGKVHTYTRNSLTTDNSEF